MTEEKLEQAETYLSGVRGAEVALKRLGKYIPNETPLGIAIGADQINITDNELEKQIVMLATDYYQKKKAECQQKFDAL